MKLNVKSFALTCGLTWGFAIFLLTWWIMLFDGITGEPTFIGRIYRGFDISPLGSFVGLVWAFGDGTHPSKKSWAQASLIFALIIFILVIIFFAVMWTFISSMFNSGYNIHSV